jgi:hypothetical protein
MHTIKGVKQPVAFLPIRWLIMCGALCSVIASDELAISSPTIIETPPLVPAPALPLLYGSVGSSGTNAAFVWTKPAPDGTTNFFLTRLNDFGRPFAEPPRLIASGSYITPYSELYPAEGGYFLRYFDKTNRAGASRLVATRIDFEGNMAFPPVVITTNIFKESDTASTGRSLLVLVENYRAEGIRLDYTLLGFNGGILSTGVFEGAAAGHSFAAASDGKDFLALWSASAPPLLRVTRFTGSDGSLTTTGLGTNSMFVKTMAHGKYGYLASGGGSLLHLRDDGTFIQKKALTSLAITSRQEVIYPEGEGWILFVSDSLGGRQTFRITPTSSGLRVDDGDSYPAFSRVDNSAPIPPLVSSIAPFGPGRFLIAQNNGVSILTKTGLTPVATPLIYAQQTGGRAAASPFGYLLLWTEIRGLDSSFRGLRFAPDGSPLDNHSFEIASFYRVIFRTGNVFFDGKDYIVAWGRLAVARISPQGAPDVRVQSYPIDTASTGAGVQVVSHKGDLFAAFSVMNPSAPYLFIHKLGADGQVGPEIIVHGFGALSDGANLFSIGWNESSEIYKIAIDPDAPNHEISTNIVAVDSGLSATQLGHGFVMQLYPPEGNSSFVYFSNGQERLRAALPTNLLTPFADSDARLLMITLAPEGSHLSRFDSFNLQTGERSSAQTDLGNVTAVEAASAGSDFFAIADAFDLQKEYVANFWITSTKPPTFAVPKIEQGSFNAPLNLNPNRRYRVETSVDLFNWNLQQVVSGSSSVNVTLPGDPQGFVRAILVPE